jgi:hypothetical protein
MCKGFNVDYVLGAIAHYELRATVYFIDVFFADKMPQIHDSMLSFAVLVEH